MRARISTKWLLPILVAATLTTALGAPGLVLVKAHPGESEEFWLPVPYGSLEQYPVSIVVHPLSGKTQTIPRSSIGRIVEFPDLSKASIVSSEEIGKLRDILKELAATAVRYKAASRLLISETSKLETALAELDAGKVLVSGAWMSRVEYDAKVAQASRPEPSASISMVFRGVTLRNVRATSVRGVQINVMHDGGIASVPIAEIAPETLQSLRAATPHLFTQPQGGKPTQTDSQTSAQGKASGRNAELLKVAERRRAAIDHNETESAPKPGLEQASKEWNAGPAEWFSTSSTFEKDRFYKLGPHLVKYISQDGILATIDAENTAYNLIPLSGEPFPTIRTMNVSESPVALSATGEPISFSAIGLYRGELPQGRGTVPVFVCVYLEIEGKVVYQAPVPKRGPSIAP